MGRDLVPAFGQPHIEETIVPLFGQPRAARGDDFERSGRRPKVRRGVWDETDGRWVTDHDGPMDTYTSVSTISDMISTGPGLMLAKVRKTAVAAYRYPEYAYIGTKDPATDKGEIDDAVRDLLTRFGDDVKAANGNVVHAFLNTPVDTPFMPANIRPDVESVHAILRRKGLERLEWEVRVVDDRRRAAGTLDDLIRVPHGFRFVDQRTGEIITDLGGKVVIGDVKTGQYFQPVKWAVQMAVYADGQRYDVHTDERSQLHPDIDKRWGIVIWIPYGSEDPRVVMVDLAVGRILADMVCIWHGQGYKGQRILSEVPDLIDFCERCNVGGHTCPGCGASVDHNRVACDACGARLLIEACESVDQLRDVWFNRLTEAQRTEENAQTVQAMIRSIEGG